MAIRGDVGELQMDEAFQGVRVRHLVARPYHGEGEIRLRVSCGAGSWVIRSIRRRVVRHVVRRIVRRVRTRVEVEEDRERGSAFVVVLREAAVQRIHAANFEVHEILVGCI